MAKKFRATHKPQMKINLKPAVGKRFMIARVF